MEFLQENWLYLLAVSAMMFIMLRRGGCCGGHSEQGHGGNTHGGGCGSSHSTNHSSSDAQTISMVKDPVCGMHINPTTSIHEMINGQSYYFCSEHCRNKFHRTH